MQVGDIVYLNSGSPPLTVKSIQDGETTCTWVVDGELRWITSPTVCFRITEPHFS